MLWYCFLQHKSIYKDGKTVVINVTRIFVRKKSDISYLKTSWAFDVLIHSGKPTSVG